MSAIRDWLTRHGLEQYADAFVDNHIDLEVLTDLNEADMRDLGVVSIGHRKRLRKAIAGLSDESNNTVRQDTERRHLTVMFCDMVGSTQLAIRLDPEDLADIVRAYQAECAQVIARFGGFIARFAGDGILAYFGYPHAHEDDAERAVRAALGIVERLPELNLGLSVDDVEVQVRIGMATGHVVVGDVIGEGSAEEAAVYGETPNLAARLQGTAAPNGIVISAATRQLLGELFEYSRPRVHELKGITQPVQAWCVIRECVVASRFTAVRRSGLGLVGREEELAKLTQSWHDATTGAGHTVRLVGEAGMGKSHLTQTLLEHIADHDHVRIQCQCSAYHISTALYPIIRATERVCGFARHDGDQQRFVKLEQWLSRSVREASELVPVLARLLNIAASEPQVSSSSDADVFKEQCLGALTRVMVELARAQPLVLIFEDVHWIDATSSDFIAQLSRRAEEVPMLLLLTHRPDFVAPWEDRPRSYAVRLSQLDREHCRVLIERVAGSSPLPDAVVSKITDRTDGVPLFVEELTRTVVESVEPHLGESSLRSIAVPSTLHATLMARLDRLGAAKDVAQAAAVLGRRFSLRLLAAVLARSPSELKLSVSQLEEASLIFRNELAVEESYEFKNALLRDIAYRSLLKRKRQELHERTAQVLTRDTQENSDAEPERLAYHFTEAGLHENAVKYWQRAGQRALERFGPKETATLFAKALSLPEGLDRDEQEMVLQADLGAVEMVRRGFDYAPAAEAFLNAHKLARDDQLQVARSLKALCWFLFRQGRLEQARDVAGGVSRMAERQPSLALAPVAHEMLGFAALLANELPRAVGYFERSMGDNETRAQKTHKHSDVDPSVVSIMLAAIPYWLLGRPDKARALIERGLSIIETHTHPPTVSITQSWAARVWPMFGDSARTMEWADATIEYALEHDMALQAAEGRIVKGWAMVSQGHAAGLSLLELGLRQKTDSGSQILLPYLLYLRADACAQLNQHDEALDLLAEATANVSRTGERWWEAELYRRRGTLLLMAPDTADDGERCLIRALEMSRAAGARALELRAALSLHEFWASAGRTEVANETLSAIYAGFSEGFETADLTAARLRLGS